MSFPQASVQAAKDIAALYNKRYSTRHQKIKALYAGAFLENSYGVNDALKRGHIGTYLHELEKDAECFSFAGMVYLIARELNLEPKLHWVSDMRVSKEGEDKTKSISGDHALVTVRGPRNREIAVDSYMNVVGKLKREDHQWRVKDGRHLEKTVHFSHCKELSEQEYVDLMEHYKTPQGTLEQLQGGIYVQYHRNRVNVQFDEQELSTRVGMQMVDSFVDDLGKYMIWRLVGPAAKNTWEPQIYQVHASDTYSWSHSDDVENINVTLQTPFALAAEYTQVLQSVFKQKRGKRLKWATPMSQALNNGFRPDGSWSKINPEAKKLNALLEQMVSDDVFVNPEKEDIINYEAIFVSERMKKRNGFVMSQKAFERFEEKCKLLYRAELDNIVDAMFETKLSEAGFLDKPKKRQKKFDILVNTDAQKVRATLEQIFPLRKLCPELYRFEMERAAMYDEWKDREATPEQIRQFQQKLFSTGLIFGSEFFHTLKLQSKRRKMLSMLPSQPR